MPTLWLLCFLGYAAGEIVKFESCGGNVTQVRVSPCPEEPCPVVKGKSIHVEADFVSPSDKTIEKLRLSVGAKVVGVFLLLPGLDRDGCQGRNITCPVFPGDRQTFVFDLNILSFFPTLEATTVFDIDGPEEKLLCFEAPVKIVNP